MQSAKKEEHIYRDEMMSFPIGSETESSPAACKKIECVFTLLRSHRNRRRKRKRAAFFLPDEFSQKDLFVRVERLLVFGKREREREREGRVSASIEDKKTLVVVIKNRSHKKSAENNERSTLQKTRWLTLMISDNSWLISAWNANVSVSASSPMIDDGMCFSFVSR